MNVLEAKEDNFYKKLSVILQERSQFNMPDIDNEVGLIIDKIKVSGDIALFDYARRLDNSEINSSNILLSNKIRKSYKDKIDNEIMMAFRVAIKNITNFHEMQKPSNYEISNIGVKTSMIWNPIESVGLYIPGGKAIYPSSLIMNIIPAKVAGVKRIVAVTPSQSNNINPYILALLDELEIEEVYQVGGAHAIASLAYGTKSIRAVNKIFGPGNAYIGSAKKQVFGKVGIDLIAGPSEIVVVADKYNNPDWVASDLIAQSEHDERAQSILITDDRKFANKVIQSIEKLMKQIKKNMVAKKSLENYGLSIIVDNFTNVHEIINFIAPEHLHLQNKSRDDVKKNITNAGGIFMGEYTCEAFGDYIVGTNHILPTSGSAKFSSGVSVLDFMKRTSVVEMNYQGFQLNQENVSKMAEVEKLEAHKLSVKIRQTQKK